MKIMRRLRRFISVVVAVCMLFSVSIFSFVSATTSDTEVIIKEFTFTSDKPTGEYRVPQEITTEDGNYRLAEDTSYKVIDEKKYAEKTVSYKDLTKKSVPSKINENGNVYTLVSPNFKDHLHSVNKTTTSPPPSKINVDTAGKTVTATLVNLNTETKKKTSLAGRKETKEDVMVPFTITGRFVGEKGVVYVFEGVEIDLGDGASPAWQGCEETLIKYFGLPNGSTITSSAWDGEHKKENGETVRYAIFSGMKPDIKKGSVPVTSTKTDKTYRATYGYYTYSADAVYTNGLKQGFKQYTIKATAKYEKYNTDTPSAENKIEDTGTPMELPIAKEIPNGLPLWAKILIGTGTGIALFALTAAVILFLMKRKKRSGNVGADAAYENMEE